MLDSGKIELVDRTVQQMLCIENKNRKKLVQAIFPISSFFLNRLIEIMELQFLIIYFLNERREKVMRMMTAILKYSFILRQLLEQSNFR